MIQEPVRETQRTYESEQKQTYNSNSSHLLETSTIATAGTIILNNLKKVNLKNSTSVIVPHQTGRTTTTSYMTAPTIQTQESSTSSTTTIPIIINSSTNPRILLIRVPTNRTRPTITEPKVPQTRYIRIPFLPGSEPTTFSVKRTLPTAVPIVSHTIPVTRSPTVNTLINTDYSIPAQPKITTTTTTTAAAAAATTSDYNCDSSLYHYPNNLSSTHLTTATTQTTQPNQETNMRVQVSRPTTMNLTSMAGVQLTEADISQMDMSGAMPTATVEEINVPVFIDEYLQELESTSTTIQNCNSENGNGHDKILNIENDEAFNNFEFDFGMIAEDNIEQNMYHSMNDTTTTTTTTTTNNNNTTNKSNNNNYNNIANDNNNIMMMNPNDYDFDIYAGCCNSSSINTANNNTAGVAAANNNNNNNINDTMTLLTMLKAEIKCEDIEEYLQISPNALSDENSVNLCHWDDGHTFNKDAIDIAQVSNDDFHLSECLNSSQQNPLLAETITINNNSQQLFTTAEPHLPTDFDVSDYYNYHTSSQPMIPPILLEADDDKSEFYDNTGSQTSDTSTVLPAVVSINVGGGMIDSEIDCRSLKRVALPTTPKHTMAEKRRRLHLDTSLRIPIIQAGNAMPLNTPDVVDLIDNMSSGEHLLNQNSNHSSTESITQNLIDSIDVEFAQDYDEANTNISTFAELYAPDTPQSSISATSSTSYTNNTIFTGSIITAPTSPAASNCSTSQYRYTSNSGASTSNKRRRGRPSKQHSDLPDPNFLSTLDENERKSLLDRAKNNEASRVSRRKNKQKEEEEIEQEKQLEDRNRILSAELELYQWQVGKLKRAVKRNHFKRSH